MTATVTDIVTHKRRLGMIATSGSWRRHWLACHGSFNNLKTMRLAAANADDARAFGPVFKLVQRPLHGCQRQADGGFDIERCADALGNGDKNLLNIRRLLQCAMLSGGN